MVEGGRRWTSKECRVLCLREGNHNHGLAPLASLLSVGIRIIGLHERLGKNVQNYSDNSGGISHSLNNDPSMANILVCLGGRSSNLASAFHFERTILCQ